MSDLGKFWWPVRMLVKVKKKKKNLELKVSKFRKQDLKFSFEPKTEPKYFCISALAVQMKKQRQIIMLNDT